jgi:hypothetical protein
MSLRATVSSFVIGLSLFFAAPAAFAATCTLGDHAGIEEVEAKTAASVVCHELLMRSAPSASYEVRLGKLSGRTMITVTEGGDEAKQVRTFLSGLDELDVAAPRLATSLVEAKPLADTRNVDNVITEEGRTAKKVATVVGATLGTYVLTSLGESSAPSGGIDVGLGFRTGRVGLSGDGRLGGVGSGATKLSNVSLDVGGRYYFFNDDFSPFIGGGVGLSHFSRGERSGGGAGAYATLGIEAMRSSHVGMVVAARVDLPFYSLEQDTTDQYTYDYPLEPPTPKAPLPSVYAAPVSLMVALYFH